MFVLLKTKPADMPEEINKTLHVTNNSGNNGSCSSKKANQSPCEEISYGCECGTASCENCPAASGMKMGSDREVGYRNVFLDLKVVAVILIATFIVKEALTLLPI